MDRLAIITELPDSGKGAGGYVIVSDMNGSSEKRALSIFKGEISNYLYGVSYIGGYPYFGGVGGRKCHFTWRCDINPRATEDSIVTFEISKASFGTCTYVTYILPWADTSLITDSCVSLSGRVNLGRNEIDFDTLKFFIFPKKEQVGFDYFLYHPPSVSFDRTGYFSGFIDSGEIRTPGRPQKWDNRLTNQSILYPPAPKSAVRMGSVSDGNATAMLVPTENELWLRLWDNEDAAAVSVMVYDVLGRNYAAEYQDISPESYLRFKLSGNVPRSVPFVEIRTSKQKFIQKPRLMLK